MLRDDRTRRNVFIGMVLLAILWALVFRRIGVSIDILLLLLAIGYIGEVVIERLESIEKLLEGENAVAQKNNQGD